MSEPLVISIILNTNRREDTIECLASLAHNTYENRRVIVLDNSSTDGSVAAIRSAFPDVRVIELAENLGYAGNNNAGMEVALAQGADWVFILNEDTILDAECLSRLVEVAESDEQVGIVGPMVYHHDEPDIIQSAGGVLGKAWECLHLGKDELDRGQFEKPHQVEWISGCAIMVKRSVIEQVGMLDADFFYFWEETEWCLRAGKAGWVIMHVPGAHLWHKGVQRDYHPKPSLLYYATRNRFKMLAKHRAPLYAWLIAWTQTLRTLISWSVRPKWRGMHEHRDAMWQGIVDFFRRRWGAMPS